MKTRPGKGWQHLGSSVYEHTSGIRAHTGCGICRLADGGIVYGENYPESKTLRQAIRIAGGKRRGVLVWAMWKAESMAALNTKGSE